MPLITPLSAPPSRASAPASYVSDMDTWLAALVTMVSEINGIDSSDIFTGLQKGAWSPEFADAESGGNTGTPSQVGGRYVYAGGLVLLQFWMFNIDTTGMTGGNTAYVQGLPYPSRAAIGASSTASLRCSSVTFTNQPFLYLPSGSEFMRFEECVSGGAVAEKTVSQFTSGAADVFGSILYETTETL